MKKQFGLVASMLPALLLSASCLKAQEQKAFGSEQEVQFAERLWQTLEAARLVGDQAFTAVPYEGTEPHGAILVTLDGMFGMDGRDAPVLVKSNYGGAGVTVESVANSPEQNLGAVTVMFRRESGFDPQHGDWFWAKYLPNGNLDKAPNGTPLAGRVAGCIGCHEAAPGRDYVYTHDRFARP